MVHLGSRYFGASRGAEPGHVCEAFIEEMCKLPENSIPIHALMDDKGAWQTIHSIIAVGVRRLRAEIARVKDILIRGEVDTLV